MRRNPAAGGGVGGTWRRRFVADWPGHRPRGAEIVKVLAAAGADVNARGARRVTEAPLQWGWVLWEKRARLSSRQDAEPRAQPKRGQARCIAMGLLLFAAPACDRGTSATDEKPSASPESSDAPRLEVDLPAGIRVTVDSKDRGSTPIEPLAIDPGAHAVRLKTACGTVRLPSFEVSASGVTRLGRGDVAELKLARLRIRARKIDGSALTPTVAVNDVPVSMDEGVEVEVPACKLRLRVASDGLGAYVEDLQAAAGETYVRDIVLAPGPDVVRIEGGAFTIGPPGPPKYDPDIEYTPGYYDLGDTPIERHEVVIETFDLDKTEVTAGQFLACFEAGACDPNRIEFRQTSRARTNVELCNTPIVLDDARSKSEGPLAIEVPPGREHHPANCVARWQAEAYCKWVGKRFPTDVEYEYAARSRKEANVCPWGGDMSTLRCDRVSGEGELGTRPVCTAAEDDSEQGVCDLGGNVNEFVTWLDLPSRRLPSDAENFCRGATDGVAFGVHAFCVPYSQDAKNGFRCARDVKAARRGTRGGARDGN